MSASSTPLLRVEALTKHFPVQKGFFDRLTLRHGRLRLLQETVHAVNGVSLAIGRGETLALVGESGCGKSTLAKTIVGLHRPTAGRVFYDGSEIGGLVGPARRPFQKRIQMVFQDPFSSLNPRKKIAQIVGLPMTAHGVDSQAERRARVEQLLFRVGLDAGYADRYPHQFSGGQRQRIGIARALACKPELVIADEPISALDVSIQAQILNLLMDLQEEFGLTYVFIAHDLAVIRHICDRVAVMYVGKLVELAASEELFNHPRHPYTEALLSASPDMEEGTRIRLQGEIPAASNPPPGCVFQTRCPRKIGEICETVEPPLEEAEPGYFKRCHIPVAELREMQLVRLA